MVKFGRNKSAFGNDERKYIPRRKYPKPMRFVGIGIIITIILILIMYKIMVK